MGKVTETSVLARGEVIAVRTLHAGGELTEVTVEVVGIAAHAPYRATIRHPLSASELTALSAPGAAVAVRVDPADPLTIVLDLDAEVPPAESEKLDAADVVEVSAPLRPAPNLIAPAPDAAEILARGEPCRVDVLAVIPTTQVNKAGEIVTSLLLTVHRDGVAPTQAEIGTAIPPDKAALVIAGATLPARWLPPAELPDGVHLVAVDWSAV